MRIILTSTLSEKDKEGIKNERFSYTDFQSLDKSIVWKTSLKNGLKITLR